MFNGNPERKTKVNINLSFVYHFYFLFLQQLRSNLREMEKLCGRVRSADATDLEKLVQPIRERASTAIQEFLRMHSNPVNKPCFPETVSTDQHIASDTSHSMYLCMFMFCEGNQDVCVFKIFSIQYDWLVDGDTGVPGSPVLQKQLLLPEIPVEQNAAESWDSLAEVTHAEGNSLSINGAHK